MNLNVNLAKFDNNELIAFGDGTNNAVKNLVGVDAVLEPFQDKLNKCKNAVNNVLEKTKAKEISAMLKKEDNFRDQYLIGLKKLIDACEYHPDETVQASAVKLNKLFDKLGDSIQKQSYDKESVTINTLLTDLKGEYATDVETVAATVFVTAIDESQTRFSTYRQQQLSENAEMTEIVSMSAIRRDFEQSLRAVLTVLPAFYQINSTPELKTAIGLIYELIQKFKSVRL